ncbi:hypothetical protein ACF08M_07160 [Streptomyces sp. NPDC015032]|uniref:hypothetical protein n=1 Tax=Streptomyces sp. NPDC015032 TaxID=3364937 RepID=UPI0036F64A8C
MIAGDEYLGERVAERYDHSTGTELQQDGLMSHDESASLPSAVSVEADDVEARVRCFFGRDPDGNVVKVLSQW